MPRFLPEVAGYSLGFLIVRIEFRNSAYNLFRCQQIDTFFGRDIEKQSLDAQRTWETTVSDFGGKIRRR